MAVGQVKLHPRPEPKIVLAANVARRLAQPTSSASGFISVLKLLAVWVSLTKSKTYTAIIFIHVGSKFIGGSNSLLFFVL
jgi:hypothetical protein